MNHPDHSFLIRLYSVNIAGWNGDETMQTKRLFPILVGMVLVALSAGSVYADPLVSGGNVTVGDRYLLTTVRGEASAWIDGH